MESFKIL